MDRLTLTRSLSPGHKFMPSDEEILSHFLYGKIKNRLPPESANLVPVCDLYAKEPWIVWEEFHGDMFSRMEDLYFFTKLNPTNPQIKPENRKKSRIKRSVGGAAKTGCWHGEKAGPPIPIEIGGKTLSGIMKRFHYKIGDAQEHNYRWLMHEFSFPEEQTEWAVCRLRKKTNKKDEGEIVAASGRGLSKKRNLEYPDNNNMIPPSNQQKKRNLEDTWMQYSNDGEVGNCSVMVESGEGLFSNNMILPYNDQQGNMNLHDSLMQNLIFDENPIIMENARNCSVVEGSGEGLLENMNLEYSNYNNMILPPNQENAIVGCDSSSGPVINSEVVNDSFNYDGLNDSQLFICEDFSIEDCEDIIY